MKARERWPKRSEFERRFENQPSSDSEDDRVMRSMNQPVREIDDGNLRAFEQYSQALSARLSRDSNGAATASRRHADSSRYRSPSYDRQGSPRKHHGSRYRDHRKYDSPGDFEDNPFYAAQDRQGYIRDPNPRYEERQRHWRASDLRNKLERKRPLSPIRMGSPAPSSTHSTPETELTISFRVMKLKLPFAIAIANPVGLLENLDQPCRPEDP